ncbi:MAG: peptidylprolyl isomerase [Candidatus Coproplasma sp.]
MKLKRLAHIACAALIAGTAYCMTFMAGCTNAHPEAEITISFDEQDYVLKYRLYRNMYPQTVQHFIELTQNGFYDGTIIHNYTNNYLYGGGYKYENESLTYEEAYEAGNNGDLETMRDYYSDVSKEKEYLTLADPNNGKITPSVYTTIDDGEYVNPLNTLIGEFTANQHKIDNGALKQTYGCLTMYYTAKSSDVVKNKRVYLDKYGSAFGVQGDYTYNSATSLFRIYTANPQTPSSLSAYCVFGTLKNTDVLDDLKTAFSDNKITSKSVTLYVDNEDPFLGPNSNEATYAMASMPIVIKTVKITKY